MIHAQMARLEEARGETEKSCHLYETILKEDPSNREALCQLASHNYYAGDAVRSFVLYRQANKCSVIFVSMFKGVSYS